MAGYPKIWTTIRHEPWFKTLPGNQRNIWLESILIAKEQTDDGWVSFRNITHMAIETGTDRRACKLWLTREAGQLQTKCSQDAQNKTKNGKVSGQLRATYEHSFVQGTDTPRIKVETNCRQLLRFHITNYDDSQQLKNFRERKSGVRKAKANELDEMKANKAEEDFADCPGLSPEKQGKGSPGYLRIGTAFVKKFGEPLKKEDYDSLLSAYQHEGLLSLMIDKIHISKPGTIKKPVGLLLKAQKSPADHLGSDEDYEVWKRVERKCHES